MQGDTTHQDNELQSTTQFWNQISQKALGYRMGYAHSVLLATKYRRDLFLRKPKDNEELEKLIKEITCTDCETTRLYNHTTNYTKTFQVCLEKSNQHISQIGHESLRNVIYKLYLDQIVPTKDILLNSLTIKEKSVPVNLNEDLKVNGFVLKKLRNTRKALIVEDPAQINKRMKYLNKVRSLRLLNRNFVYVSFKDVKFPLAVSPHTTGVLSLKLHTDSSDEVTKQMFTFTKSMIPLLPESSVVVLDTQGVVKSHLPPNPYSSKQQMKEWLTKHEVPYKENAHTAELYALIEKFGVKEESCHIRALLESHGFCVLKVPTELPSLNYFSPIFRQMQNIPYMTEAQYVSSIFGKYETKELCLLEEALVKEEMRVYTEDVVVEKIIDNITRVASHMAFSENDLKSFGLYDPDPVPSYIILD